MLPRRRLCFPVSPTLVLPARRLTRLPVTALASRSGSASPRLVSQSLSPDDRSSCALRPQPARRDRRGEGSDAAPTSSATCTQPGSCTGHGGSTHTATTTTGPVPKWPGRRSRSPRTTRTAVPPRSPFAQHSTPDGVSDSGTSTTDFCARACALDASASVPTALGLAHRRERNDSLRLSVIIRIYFGSRPTAALRRTTSRRVTTRSILPARSFQSRLLRSRDRKVSRAVTL